MFRNVENEYEMHGGITVVYDESVHEVRRVQDVSAIDRSIFEPSIGDQHRGVRDVLHVPGELLRVSRH